MSPRVQATVRTLWRRAPLWRSLIYLACPLSALVLFLPHEVHQTRTPWQETASYVPPVKPHLAVAQPSSSPSVSPGTPNPDTSVPTRANPPAPTNVSITLGAPSNSVATDTTGSAPPVSGEVGKVYSGFYPIHGRRLPLRPGSWTVLAEIASQRPDSDLHSVLLGQIEGHRLKGAVLFTDFQSLRGGWTSRFAGCTDRYNLDSHVDDGSPARQACWTVRNVFSTAWKQWRDRNMKMDPIFRAAAGELEIKGVQYPQDLLQVFFHTADDGGALNAVYYFNPTDEGLTATPVSMWLRSDWSADNIGRYPDKVAYEKRLNSWGSQWWPRIISVAALPRH
jgi:hypothetical protein